MSLLSQQRIVGIITIISGLLALGNVLASLVAINYNFEVFADPVLILSLEGVNIEAMRWALILDMFGFYMLLLPVIILMHEWLKKQTPWSNLITFCGLAYVLIGTMGAAILAMVWPSIMHAFPNASPELQLILQTQFKLFSEMVYGGLWNLAEILFASTWWLWLGVFLYRNQFRFVGVISIITGTACLGDGISGIFQLPVLHEITLNMYLVFAIIWAFITGIFLYRRKLG